MSYHHLALGERECILLMHHNQKDITQITQVLGWNKSTISRELHGNIRRHGYSSYEAQNSYTIRRRACKPQLKVIRPERNKHIINGLEEHWSPEQIIGHHGMSLCTATIYRVLKDDLLPTVLPEKTQAARKIRQSGR